MEQSPFTYFAFISYKREDEKWAKWLQKKLEHYKLPTAIRKQHPDLDFAERPRLVFKDTTDLSGGVLKEAIRKGLAESKYLIVICSPRAAQSPWVCDEVQYFIDHHREQYIIPFIIEGTPYAEQAEQECFPTSLRTLAGERELLGININENGRDSAAIKVIARMFDVRFDVLWQRFRREERRRRFLATLLLLLIAVAGVAFGMVFYRLNVNILERNKTIETQQKSIAAQRDQLQKDSTALAAHVARIQSDSVHLVRQKDSIIQTNERLTRTIAERDMANAQLENEKQNLLTSQSRLIAAKVSRMVDDGDSYKARQLALELFNGKYPYTVEAEAALRKAAYGETATFRGHTYYVTSVSFSPDGRQIVSGSDDKTIKLWEISLDAILSRVRKQFEHCPLTPEERRKYGLE